MLILAGVILLLFALLVVGTMISNRYSKKAPEESVEETATEIPLDCCGAHEVCDFDAMIKNKEEVIYFDDEELDRFKNMAATSYNNEQIDEFRDVLYTLQGHEIKKWLLSIQRRNIQLPAILQQEALMLIAES